MNKTLLWLVIVLLIIAGGGLLIKTAQPGDMLYPLKAYFSGQVDYVVDISNEVTLLEAELADIDAKIAAGELTEEEALAARDRVIARLDNINASVVGAGKAELTPEMRVTIREALTRLSGILTTYRDSLATVEEIAESAEDKPRLNPRVGAAKKRSLTAIVVDTVETLEEHVEDVTGDTFEDLVPEEIAEEIAEEEAAADSGTSDDANATNTPDGTDEPSDSDTETEEPSETDPEGESEETTSDDTPTDDASTTEEEVTQ